MSLSKTGVRGLAKLASFQRFEATKGGLYASSLMSWMMSHGEDFYGLPVHCQDVALVSTPPQLEDFVRKVSSGQVLVAGTLRNPCCEGWNAPALGFFGRKEGFEWVVNGSDRV